MIKKNFKVLIFCIFFSIFFSNIFLLSTNLPVQDDWNNIYLLNKFDGNIIKFFLIQDNNHFIFFSRILFFLNDYYLNLNFKITDYISFVLLIFLFFKIYNLIKVKNNYYFLILVSLIFSGRLFPIITQSFNIVWILSFLLLLFFIEAYNKSNKRISYKVLFLILCNILNFGLHIVIPIFLTIYLIIQENKKINIIYLLFYFLIFYTTYFLSEKFVGDYNSITSSVINLKLLIIKFDFLPFFFTLFSNLSSIYFPIIKSFAPASFVIGFIQVCLIIILFFKNNKLKKKSIIKFLNENFLITLGILASTQIAFFRTFDSMEVRFSIISIIFQIGFWNYFFHEIKKRFLLKYLSIFVSFVLFVTGYFSPYLGTYWQTVSYNKTLAIKECLKKNTIETKKCDDLIYFYVFNNGNWFDKSKFKIVISELRKEKKIFFNEKYINH